MARMLERYVDYLHEELANVNGRTTDAGRRELLDALDARSTSCSGW